MPNAPAACHRTLRGQPYLVTVVRQFGLYPPKFSQDLKHTLHCCHRRMYMRFRLHRLYLFSQSYGHSPQPPWEIIVNHNSAPKDLGRISVKQFLNIQSSKICIHPSLFQTIVLVWNLFTKRGLKVISCKDGSNLLSFTSKPRAATSVATRNGHLALQKSLNIESLWVCDLSLWMSDAW
jgi:hypothetical protein